MSLPFPNVPFAPGVPQVPRSAGAAIAEVVSLGTNAISGMLWQSSNQAPTWGILDSSGNAVVTPDSFIDFGNANESNIPNFPIQQGAFATYNKVILPFTITLRLSKGGSQADRTAFLQSIAALYQSLDLYTILTPEQSYPNMNLQRYEVQRRGRGGAFFLTEVDLSFIQINQVSAQYSSSTADTQNAQNPSAQGPTNTGAVLAQAPSSAASNAAATGLGTVFGY